jgi:hypothetical protein
MGPKKGKPNSQVFHVFFFHWCNSFAFFRKRKPRKNVTKQWFPKNMSESPIHQDDNPPDVPGRTEVTAQGVDGGGDELYLTAQGVDVVPQESEGVAVGHLTAPRLLLGATTSVPDVGHLTAPRLLLGATTSVPDVGHLTPPRIKKRAIGKKLTPKKKNA